MVTKQQLDDKFFHWLLQIDEATCREVAARGCPHCPGRLHRADYPRKPRGGLLGGAGEAFSKRLSLCCGREGCRRRTTPPSVRFLGRRVYLGVVLLLASALMNMLALAAVARETEVSARTLRRWSDWWHSEFPLSRLYQEQRGRLLPPLSLDRMPASLVERFEATDRSQTEVLVRTLCFLSPLSTGPDLCEARYVRDR